MPLALAARPATWSTGLQSERGAQYNATYRIEGLRSNRRRAPCGMAAGERFAHATQAGMGGGIVAQLTAAPGQRGGAARTCVQITWCRAAREPRSPAAAAAGSDAAADRPTGDPASVIVTMIPSKNLRPVSGDRSPFWDT